MCSRRMLISGDGGQVILIVNYNNSIIRVHHSIYSFISLFAIDICDISWLFFLKSMLYFIFLLRYSVQSLPYKPLLDLNLVP